MAEQQVQEASEEVTFEQALEKLETIVKAMEAGDLPLEKAISEFQEGMQLARICREKLDQAEQKIEVLVAEAGTLTKKPFQSED